MRRFTVIFLLLAVIFAFPAKADIVQPDGDFYYLDEAGVLSEATEGEIYFCNQNLCKECGAQIVIVAIDSTDGVAIDEYAYDLFNQWGIGDVEENNGFLLLMTIADDNYYAMAGTGLESLLSDGIVENSLYALLEPYFAAKDYDTGARMFFEKIYAEIADMYNVESTVQDGVQDYEAFISGTQG